MTKKTVKNGVKKKGPGRASTQFSKENQPLNNGRKKSILNYLAEYQSDAYKIELSREDKGRIIEIMLEKSQDELTEILNDVKRPMFERIVANAIKNEVKNGDLEIFSRILDRVHGKPTQKIETTGTGGGPIQTQEIPPKTATEATNRIKELFKRGR